MRPAGSVTRIMVMGPPGSGKSTVARQLGAVLGVPVTHLDALHHSADWQPRPAKDFAADVAHAVAAPGWVIDGNYTGVIDGRLARADLVIVLDASRATRMARILRRIVMGYGRVRADSAPGCLERLDPAFLQYAWTWDHAVRPRLEAAIAGHESRIMRLVDQRAINALVLALSSPARASAP